MSVRALEGRALGRPPYGYRIGPSGRLEIYSSEAQVVRMIFRMYTRYGLGLRLIGSGPEPARAHDPRAVRSWSVASVRGILRNPAYIGTYTRLGMRRPNAHEAIVQPESFRAAQETARSRRPFGRVNSSRPVPDVGPRPLRLLRQRHDGSHQAQIVEAEGRRKGVRDLPLLPVPVQEQPGPLRVPHLAGGHASTRPWSTSCGPPPGRGQLGDGAGEHDGATASEAANAERRMLDAVRRAARGEITTRTLGEYLAELDTARQVRRLPPARRQEPPWPTGPPWTSTRSAPW